MELNKLYCMDNLELLRELPSNSIDLIYCDILYNTGKKFKDYDDNLGTPQEAIEWYRPRLIEMKRVLKNTGSIYLQCDYRLVHYIKVEMDNIFGINNFRNEIIWCYKSGGSCNKSFSKKHDNILFYSKSNL
jgi:adenine specific DNA methylase Mod